MKAVLSLIVSLTLISAAATAETPTLRLFGSARALEISAELIISDDSGTSTRSIEILYNNNEGRDYQLRSQVTSPAFLRNMKFLVTQEGSVSNTWIATSRGVQRVGNRGSGERVFGSDFLISDFSGWNLDDYRISDIPGSSWQKAEALSAENKEAFRFQIHPEYDLVAAIDFLGPDGQISRSYRVLSYTETSSVILPQEARMETVADGSSSLLRLKSVNTDPRFGPRSFNPAGL
ncbi:outer membrane lipoprotein-sorting protein [Spirochaeta dissipatitropha]